MSAPYWQAIGGDSSQPQATSELSYDHQTRIRNLQQAISNISTSFAGLSEKERTERQQLWRDAYGRIIDYYRKGKQLPSGGEPVYTIVGNNGVWLGTHEEGIRRAEKLKGIPIFDVCLTIYAPLNIEWTDPNLDLLR